MGEIDYASPNV